MERRVTERPPPPAADVRRIGCLMLNGVGDILCCTPALDALKARYPEAHLVAMVRPHLASLVDTHPAVDSVLPFGMGSAGERLRFLRRLRAERFDLFVDLHTPTFNTVTSNTRHFMRNALLILWSGARYRRAYPSPPLGPLLTHPLPPPSQEALRALNVVDLTLPLGWPAPGAAYRKRIGVTDADRAWAREQLPGGPPRIALYFGTRQPAKLWPLESMHALVTRILANRPEVELVLVGDATDAPRAADLLRRAGAQSARMLDFTGRASFTRTGALMERCAAIVSSDSGPMHIADAVEVPMVALFSSHNYPAVWRPMSPRAVVIHHDIECGPCWLAECPVGNRCMANITPDEVYRALEERLAGAATR